ncbi:MULTISPECIES: hypothetical protein [Enterobacteriaceae]|jgi:hypothetical protein|uniref:Two-component-system connector protein YcgZ n=2 Tax=Enterobacteriaceae TaxID=543 RepID=A0ABW1Q5X1_9ENTR|nr:MULTISPECIES: hypothetical protein [Enterobacteriaceae]AUU88177.1 two-component-system connector protein YcgZ [Enterobacteriaceae bacterium ENNIH3]AUV06525.1 two-component-system connector protein YcgZ [Enterobacteriaceae bacterium ENNIH2]MBS6739849.1 two-component-system connector protein YcgZ [Enterobacteriaceae bacterium]PTA89513.1 two-component-system connector protein YcgZ [Kluyvera sp. Nf5]PWF53190.1 two-component-system connector protein YcgZ [[Kluyvera] intestini]PXW57668.1 hypothe
MNNSHSDGPQETAGDSGNGKLSLEQTLGAIVIQMLREGRYITRHSLCIAVAGCIEKNTRPELEAHYADILRVLLSREAD